MRRVPGLIVVVAFAVVGCGGGSEEERAVKEAIADFSDAMKEKDTRAACALLTERARDQMAEIGKQLSSDSCEKTFSLLIAYEPEYAESFDGGAKNVQVTGLNATADIGELTATMIKEGGAWKIDVDAGS